MTSCGVRRRPLSPSKLERLSATRFTVALASRSPESSTRWARSSIRRRGSGRPRASPASSVSASRRRRVSALSSRPSCSRRSPSSSARTGTAFSAAALGVGARWSDAWSISVVSVSWPTAEISGIAEAAAARTTTSSLKAHRSSRPPPPRATISRSGRGTRLAGARRLKPSMAAATSPAARARPAPRPATRARGAESGRPGDAGCRGSPRPSAR